MPKINWTRLFIGGLVAAAICFLTDGLLHERIVSADWQAVFNNLHAAAPQEHGSHIFYFVVFEIGRGFTALIVYALMRPFFTPGAKTAALAGLVAWFACSLTTPAQFIPLGFFSQALWLKVGAYQLITSLVSTIAGAALYKD